MKILILNEPNQLTWILKSVLDTYHIKQGNIYRIHDVEISTYNPKKPPDIMIGIEKPAEYSGLFLELSLFTSPIRGSAARTILDTGIKQVVREKADEPISTGSKKTNKKHTKNSTVTTNEETTVRKRGRPRGSRSRK